MKRKLMRKRLLEIAVRHHVDHKSLADAMRGVISRGATVEQAFLTIRVGVATVTGIHEYFSAKDVSIMTGIPENEAADMMEKSPDAIKVYYPQWMTNFREEESK